MSDTQNEQTGSLNDVREFELKLTLQELNAVIGALQEAPFKHADPVIKKIVPQAQAQLQQQNPQQ